MIGLEPLFIILAIIFAGTILIIGYLENYKVKEYNMPFDEDRVFKNARCDWIGAPKVFSKEFVQQREHNEWYDIYILGKWSKTGKWIYKHQGD